MNLKDILASTSRWILEVFRANLMRDHCIETLRQGIMCRGDPSLATYSYIEGTGEVTARTWGQHQCIDYEPLSNWIQGRAIDIFAEGILARPEDLNEVHFTAKKRPH